MFVTSRTPPYMSNFIEIFIINYHYFSCINDELHSSIPSQKSPADGMAHQQGSVRPVASVYSDAVMWSSPDNVLSSRSFESVRCCNSLRSVLSSLFAQTPGCGGSSPPAAQSPRDGLPRASHPLET